MSDVLSHSFCEDSGENKENELPSLSMRRCIAPRSEE